MSNFETRWEREGQEFLAYCTEQAEQKPVAVVEITYGREPECYVTGSIDDFPEGVFKLYAAPVPITTPDVCGEVCVRAKLCYGCGKALDEANAKFTEQAEQEPVDGVLPCPFCGDSQPTVFEGSTFRWRVAVCNNCGAYAPEVRHDTLTEDQKQAGIESDAAAKVAWNTRAAPVRTKDLTDDEIVKVTGCEKDRPLWLTVSSIARAVIAADREKNK